MGKDQRLDLGAAGSSEPVRSGRRGAGSDEPVATSGIKPDPD
jgi:hypothetical protein